jgi:hypothetical protein
VDGKTYIGIYINQASATVVSLNAHGRSINITNCFSVSIEQPAEADSSSNPAEDLAEHIWQKASQKNLSFQDNEIFLALDCSMFLQHLVRTEFTDPYQILTTIRSSTEEVFAGDLSDYAITYKIASKDPGGSNVTVYTVKRKIINDIISAFQKRNIDPVTIEPDIVCLSKFVSHSFPSRNDAANIFAFLSINSGFILAPSVNPDKASILRTFFIHPNQNRTSLLKNHLTLTLALLNQNIQGASFKILDSTDSVNPQSLNAILPAEIIDLNSYADPAALADCKDKVDFTVAYGAALGFLEKSQAVDFRKFVNPFQGQKIRLQKTLKIVCICAVICLVALGIFFQQRLYAENKPRKLLHANFESDFLYIIPASKEMPMPFSEAVRKLERERNRLINLHQGRFDESGQNSVPSKLTLLLKAFNQDPKSTGIAVDSISITAKTITLSASTTSKQNTLKLRDAVLKNNLVIKQENDLGFKDGRNLFKLTLESK